MASIPDLTEQIKVYETKAHLIHVSHALVLTKVGRGKIVYELCTKIEMERPFFIRINPKIINHGLQLQGCFF